MGRWAGAGRHLWCRKRSRLGLSGGVGVVSPVGVEEAGKARPPRGVGVQPGVEQVGDLAGPGTAGRQPIDAAPNALDPPGICLVAGGIGERLGRVGVVHRVAVVVQQRMEVW